MAGLAARNARLPLRAGSDALTLWRYCTYRMLAVLLPDELLPMSHVLISSSILSSRRRARTARARADDAELDD